MNFSDLGRRAAPVILCLVLFGAALKRAAPSVTPGDSAELSAAQTTLGIAHSPGYPLFTTAGKAFASLVPMGNPGFRTNLFCVALAGFCGCLGFWLLASWTGSPLLSFCAVLLIFSVDVIAGQFITTEVFALNTAALLLILAAASAAFLPSFRDHPWHAGRSARGTAVAGLLLGLGLGNQHTLVLAVPALLYLALAAAWDRSGGGFSGFTRRSAPALGMGLLFFAVGLSLYAALPIRSLREPLLDWEDPQTLDRFLGVVGRARYGMFQLAQGQAASVSAARLWERTSYFFAALASSLSAPGFVLLAAGGLLALARRGTRRMAAALVILIFFSGPFFLALSNIGTGPGSGEILARFLPVPVLSFCLLGCLGFSHFSSPAVVAAVFLAAWSRLPDGGSLRRAYFLHDYGKNVLRTLPRGSILIADRADEVEFSLAYLLYAEGRRPDVRFIDANAGVTRSIYGNDYYKVWGAPRLAVREMREAGLIRGTDRPAYYATVDPGMIAIRREPEGMIFRAKPADSPFVPWDRFYTLRARLDRMAFREAPLLLAYAEWTGRYLLERGRSREAGPFFEMCALADPGGGWNHSAALWFMEKGALRESEIFFLRALKTDPDSVQAHYNLGVLYWKSGRWADVAREFQAVLRSDPSNRDAAGYLEVARRRAGGL